MPFLKISSLIFRWTKCPNFIAQKIGIGHHQICAKKSNFSSPCQHSCATRTTLKTTKNIAKVVRNSDLFLKSFFSALATNGPPMPKAPCEMPPINSRFFLKNFGKTNLSKNIVLMASKISKMPKITDKICDEKWLKIATPKMVPSKQIGAIFCRIFWLKDLKSVKAI